MPAIILKPGREKSILRWHPWIFSGAIDRMDGKPEPGETVEILSAAGALLGRGAYSPRSQITVRMWSFDPGEEVGPALFHSRLTCAIEIRAPLLAGGDRAACRLVNAESDLLPGLIVDRYADFLVCQFLSAGAERWKPDIVKLLVDLSPCRGVFERSDVEVRRKEGLAPMKGVLQGEHPPDLVEILENGCRYLVDVVNGQKTGFFLDQRDSRVRMAWYAKGREVLNGFAYTGGFGIAAARAGAAHVVNIESSASAIDLAHRNAALNRLEGESFEVIKGDVFRVMRDMVEAGREFDLVVVDPPKYADARKHVDRAARAYKDVNLQAFKLLRPGGILFTFSCSGAIAPDLFQKIVADAALDAGRFAQILERLTQAPDHPVALPFPEGRYLKGLVCRAG